MDLDLTVVVVLLFCCDSGEQGVARVAIRRGTLSPMAVTERLISHSIKNGFSLACD